MNVRISNKCKSYVIAVVVEGCCDMTVCVVLRHGNLTD